MFATLNSCRPRSTVKLISEADGSHPYSKFCVQSVRVVRVYSPQSIRKLRQRNETCLPWPHVDVRPVPQMTVQYHSVAVAKTIFNFRLPDRDAAANEGGRV